VLGGPERFWFAKHPRLFALWEYSHRRDAQFGNNARWFITVSSEGIVWYFSPVESIVEMFLGRTCFFPPNISRSALGGGAVG
jgi:hypothetical protein